MSGAITAHPPIRSAHLHFRKGFSRILGIGSDLAELMVAFKIPFLLSPIASYEDFSTHSKSVIGIYDIIELGILLTYFNLKTADHNTSIIGVHREYNSKGSHGGLIWSEI
jgi:hypothetical protein